MKAAMPPFIAPSDKVILFDGVCKLCNGWSRFIIRHDHQQLFKLASVQSPEGQAILDFFAMPTDRFDTLLYIEGRKKYEKSDAVLRILAQLDQPWRSAVFAKMLPCSFRDWAYDRIARNRYSLFGRHSTYHQCLLPSADHDSRFLTGD